MRRTLTISLALSLALAAGSSAQTAAPTATPTATPTPPAAQRPVPREQLQAALKVGDPAPALGIKEWIKGAPVKSFEKDKVYVVEFWATWCGPCIASIPKLTAMQAKYKDKGVTILGVSTDQEHDKVRPFVEKMGDKMNYTVALDDGATMRNYLMAVGQGGIPYAFVVDKSGKVAWHGHPADGMESVIEQVAAGTFDPAKHAESKQKFRELVRAYGEAAQKQDWDAAEKVLTDIAQVAPDQAGMAQIARYTIIATGRKDVPKALEFAQTLAAGPFKDKAMELTELADKLISTPDMPESGRPVAVDIARQASLAHKGTDIRAQVLLSEALKRAGRLDEAIEAAKSAVALAPDEMQKQYYGQRVKDLEELKSAGAAESKPGEPAEKPADAKP